MAAMRSRSKWNAAPALASQARNGDASRPWAAPTFFEWSILLAEVRGFE